jgi:hypothetical protein
MKERFHETYRLFGRPVRGLGSVAVDRRSAWLPVVVRVVVRTGDGVLHALHRDPVLLRDADRLRSWSVPCAARPQLRIKLLLVVSSLPLLARSASKGHPLLALRASGAMQVISRFFPSHSIHARL